MSDVTTSGDASSRVHGGGTGSAVRFQSADSMARGAHALDAAPNCGRRQSRMRCPDIVGWLQDTSAATAELMDEVLDGLELADDEIEQLASTLEDAIADCRAVKAAAIERRSLNLPAARDPGPSQEQRS